MEKLRIRSNESITRVSLEYQRDEIRKLEKVPRLTGIKGARGVGKTTLLLQHLKQKHGLEEVAIYLSLDDIVFTDKRLTDVVVDLYRNGLKYLYLDEVHKYPHWSVEVKNLYDTYPDLQIMFTGSSMLEIGKGNADLSRRAIVFSLQGLSFRQFLALKYGMTFPVFSMEEVVTGPNQIISQFPGDFRPYLYFREYLQSGYYPYFLDSGEWYFERLESTLKAVVETDFAFLRSIDLTHARKIYSLLYAIATSPPFKPNISKLSERLEISRTALLQYLDLLGRANILGLLKSSRKGVSSLQKPEKIYLENTNIIYTLNPNQPNLGSVRETFVFNQLKADHLLEYPDQGDFLIDQKYTVEVGGKSKGQKQIAGRKKAYIAADDLDYAIGNKIPIYLFGFLY